jgi:hypothetical protein
MTCKAPNKTLFLPAYEKGHFSYYIMPSFRPQQSRYASRFTRYELCSLYKQILTRTPSRLKTSVNPVILSNFSSCSSCIRGEKIRVISVNPWFIKDLRACKALYISRETFTDVMSALQIKLFYAKRTQIPKSQVERNY